MRYVIQEGERFGYIDRLGQVVIAPRYDEARAFSEGVAWVRKGDAWSLISADGSVLLEPRVEFAMEFDAGLAVIERHEKCGLIALSGEEVISPIYDALHYERRMGDLMRMKRRDLDGLVDLRAQEVLPPRFEKQIDLLSAELCTVHDEAGRWGVWHRSGQLAAPCEFEALARFRPWPSGYLLARRDSRFGIVDLAGQTLVPFEFDDLQAGLCEGLAWARVGDRYGYVDGCGAWVVKAKFARAFEFRFGRARVVDATRRSGFVDRTGALVIPHEFDVGSDGFIAPDRARVTVGGKAALIDGRGRFVAPPIYNYLGGIELGGLLRFYGAEGLCGFMDLDGKVVVQPSLDVDETTEFENGLLQTADGYVDPFGRYVWKSPV